MLNIQRAERWEWNLNTTIAVAGLCLTALGMSVIAAGIWFGLRADVQALKEYRLAHDKLAEAAITRGETRAFQLDDRLDQQEALTLRLSDRVSAAETRGTEFAQSLRELQSSINSQSGDIKVILDYVAEQRRQRNP